MANRRTSEGPKKFGKENQVSFLRKPEITEENLPYS
jgi:hypothetical protein